MNVAFKEESTFRQHGYISLPWSHYDSEQNFFDKSSFFLFYFFETESSPGWSAVAQSWLIATSAFWAQMILLYQPPEWLGISGMLPHA